MDTPNVNPENEAFSAWVNSTENKEELERKLRQLLVRHARAVTFQRLGAIDADIVNMAVYLGIKNAPTFRGDSQFSTWFQTIVINLCNRRLQTKLRLKETPLDDHEAELSTSARGIEAKLQLESLVAKLKPEEQEIVQHKLHGLTEVEIAALMHLTRVQVSLRWLAIRRKLGGLKLKAGRSNDSEGDTVAGVDEKAASGETKAV